MSAHLDPTDWRWDHSIGRGDKVAIMMGNRPEFLICWFALSQLGAIEVPINTAHRGTLLHYMARRFYLPINVVAVPDGDTILLKAINDTAEKAEIAVL